MKRQLLIVLLAALTLASCGTQNTVTTEALTTTATPVTSEALTTTAAPVTTEAPTTTAAPTTTGDGWSRDIYF